MNMTSKWFYLNVVITLTLHTFKYRTRIYILQIFFLLPFIYFYYAQLLG